MIDSDRTSGRVYSRSRNNLIILSDIVVGYCISTVCSGYQLESHMLLTTSKKLYLFILVNMIIGLDSDQMSIPEGLIRKKGMGGHPSVVDLERDRHNSSLIPNSSTLLVNKRSYIELLIYLYQDLVALPSVNFFFHKTHTPLPTMIRSHFHTMSIATVCLFFL